MAGAGMNDPQLPEQYWRTRSESFDTVAELYDAYRPTYPADLIDSILCITKIPSTGQILEIGSGTGKATQLFAEKGFRVHCIEPGENLLQVARRKLQNYPQVSYAQVRFEDWSEEKERFAGLRLLGIGRYAKHVSLCDGNAHAFRHLSAERQE